MTAAVLWLDEIREGDRERVGGKAYALARLRQRGLPVPEGFVLPAGLPPEAALAAYARLGGEVAVRSSSSAEDLADASFAGQYRTILGVSGEPALHDAIRACRDSAIAAAGYARALGAGEGALAVLVQRMLAPRAAGVAFTRHPTEEGRLLVESHAGLGDAVVAGTVAPDRYVLDRATGECVEGTAARSLSPRDLAAVRALALQAEAELGSPQDVEWAIVGDAAILLQSRPVTVERDEGLDPRLHRLTRANVGEVLPDPVTPLTWSTVGAFLEHGFRSVAAAAGVLPPDAGPFLALYRRRLYLNLSLCVEIAGRLPGVSQADAEALILGRRSEGGGHGLPTPSPIALGVAVRLLGLSRGLPAGVAEAVGSLESLASGEELEAADAAALGAALRRFQAAGRAVARAHIAVSGACGFRMALLARLLDAWRPGETGERINRLVAGLPDLASVAPAVALEAMARDAATEPAWREWLGSADADLGRAPPALRARLEAFLRRFGHRAVAEGELSAAAWEDDPRPVVSALSTLLRSDLDLALRRRAAADTRAADEDALLAGVGPLRRAVLAWALAAARDAVRERERTKELSVRLVHHGRRLARISGRRLVEAKRLAAAEDVFLLSVDELSAALRGTVPSRAVLERRRRRQEREGRLPAPREVDLRAEAAGEDAPGSLRGTPVAAGTGLGPARVLGEGADLRLEPGEVLVTRVLDAAYGPLLAASAGAVAEIGGLLSHGAVVARELGIPCVVDVRGATSAFATGERVLVDGGRGLVTRAAAEGAEPTAAPPLLALDPATEARHVLEAHRDARESVYLNVQDPETDLVAVASVGVRRGDRGESLLALRRGDGPLLFAIELGASAPGPLIEVGGVRVEWHPFRYRFSGRLAAHDIAEFPPAPVPLLLAPRTVAVELDLAFEPTTPAIDFSQSLSEDQQQAVVPLAAHHVEQSGLWRGSLTVDGRRLPVRGTGSRDHSWGRRSWDAADHWRLFTARLQPRGTTGGAELGIHALSFSVLGRKIEGGFLARGGAAERITRVTYAPDAESGSGFELVLLTERGESLRLRGTMERTLVVPVDVDRRLLSHLAGRPYRLLLRENFTRYEGAGYQGRGMAELTVRPR